MHQILLGKQIPAAVVGLLVAVRLALLLLVALASSVSGCTKNKHGLRFGGRDEETEVYMSNIVGKPLIAGGGYW